MESLKKRGIAEELTSVDVIAGLDLLSSRGQWSKCLQTAENEVSCLAYTGGYAAKLGSIITNHRLIRHMRVVK